MEIRAITADSCSNVALVVNTSFSDYSAGFYLWKKSHKKVSPAHKSHQVVHAHRHNLHLSLLVLFVLAL